MYHYKPKFILIDSRKTAGSRAQLITMPISVSLLEGAGDLLGLTEKGDMWYLHLSVALSGFENYEWLAKRKAARANLVRA